MIKLLLAYGAYPGAGEIPPQRPVYEHDRILSNRVLRRSEASLAAVRGHPVASSLLTMAGRSLKTSTHSVVSVNCFRLRLASASRFRVEACLTSALASVLSPCLPYGRFARQERTVPCLKYQPSNNNRSRRVEGPSRPRVRSVGRLLDCDALRKSEGNEQATVYQALYFGSLHFLEGVDLCVPSKVRENTRSIEAQPHATFRTHALLQRAPYPRAHLCQRKKALGALLT